MKILVDIGHPAHVHLYKNLILSLTRKGYSVVVVTKDDPVIKQLLLFYEIPYEILGLKKDSIYIKIFNQLKLDYLMWRYVMRNKIDLAVGSSITIAHVTLFSKMRSIVFDDDDDYIQPLFVKFAHPFCTTLVSPDALSGRRKRKDTHFYPGYHELAYLHPERFTPDPSILSEIGIKEDEMFFVLRFNAFKAHHDLNARGLSLAQKIRLIEVLKPSGKIFITTERGIEPELEEYRLMLHPGKIHSLLYYATLFVGDSQTMTSESGALGTPAVKCNNFAGELSIPNEYEVKYHLCISYKPDQFDEMIKTLARLIATPDLKAEWRKRRDKMLEDKIDVTSYMIWLVENYPETTSADIDDSAFFRRFS